MRENQHKNTIFIIALAFLLCGLLFCGAAAADGAHPHKPDTTHSDISNWTEWSDPSNLPSTTGSYYLKIDIHLFQTWNAPSGTTNLCLNGHVIKTNTNISIGSDAKLNLYDCGEGGSITKNHSTDTSSAVYIDGGTFNMSGGTITLESSHTEDRCGVYVANGGTFNMSDNASITGNTASQNGGGVYVASGGTFTMEGGTITGNTANQNGGGVYVASGGTFTMEGGIITGNTAVDGGGGVYVANGGTFTMSGGSITGNTANSNGGGVYVASGGTFTMEGGIITGNTAVNGGGGVYVANGGTFTMSGGSIAGNTANSNGGGVHVGGTFEMKGGTITENTVNSMLGGGVYVDDDGTFNVSGAPFISRNTSYTTFSTATSNVCLRSGLITVTGPLTSSADLWIQPSQRDDFAQGTSEYTVTDFDAIFFHPDSGAKLAVGTPDNKLKWVSPGYKTTAVTFENGGNIPEATYTVGQVFYLPKAPVKAGDTFIGWKVKSTGEYFCLCHQIGGYQYLTPSPYYLVDNLWGLTCVWRYTGNTLTLTAVWSGTGPGPTPSSGDMTVSYQTGGGSYTLVIPSELPLTRGVIKTATIAVTDVSVTDGYHVDVSLTSYDVDQDDKSKFLLKLTGTNAEDAEYRIAKSEDAFSELKGPFIKTGDNVLETVKENKWVNLYFKMTKDPATAGKYTGTITFTASVNPDAQAS